MSFQEKLHLIQKKSHSQLCVGLDFNPCPQEFPDLIDFSRKVIDITEPFVCAYKLKFSSFLSMGLDGLTIMKQVADQIPDHIPWILDANFGELPLYAEQYQSFAYEIMNADAVTVNPYLGWDGIEPFVGDKDRYCFVLTMTSNATAEDFERFPRDFMLSLQVARKIGVWRKNYDNLGMVLGGQSEIEMMQALEENDGLVLLPGLGQQGGSVASLKRKAQYSRYIVNISKAILYAQDIKKSVEDFYRLTLSESHSY